MAAFLSYPPFIGTTCGRRITAIGLQIELGVVRVIKVNFGRFNKRLATLNTTTHISINYLETADFELATSPTDIVDLLSTMLIEEAVHKNAAE